MKILVCSDSAVVTELLRLALEPIGHHVEGHADPATLAAEARDAGALLAEPDRARQVIAVLRDRGFAGRALVMGDQPLEQLQAAAAEAGADGVLALGPADDLARRFALAVGGRRRVLVVDDSEITARLLAEELRSAGFDVLTARDAESATSLLLKRATRPDLVLLDIHMPKVSGAQFCRFIKKNDMFRSIKVIFCSGDSREKVAQLAAECGADGYVLKDQFLGKWIVENT